MRYLDIMPVTLTKHLSVDSSLRDKCRALDAEIERHAREMAALEADRDEIVAAIATLEKYGLIAKAASNNNAIGSGHVKMTVPDMILDILEHDYPDGSEPQPVLTKIKEKFDPNADPNNVRPTMWRMAKDGRLEKHGDKYRLPQKNEAAGTPSQSAPTASVTGHDVGRYAPRM